MGLTPSTIQCQKYNGPAPTIEEDDVKNIDQKLVFDLKMRIHNSIIYDQNNNEGSCTIEFSMSQNYIRETAMAVMLPTVWSQLESWIKKRYHATADLINVNNGYKVEISWKHHSWFQEWDRKSQNEQMAQDVEKLTKLCLNCVKRYQAQGLKEVILHIGSNAQWWCGGCHLDIYNIDEAHSDIPVFVIKTEKCFGNCWCRECYFEGDKKPCRYRRIRNSLEVELSRHNIRLYDVYYGTKSPEYRYHLQW